MSDDVFLRLELAYERADNLPKKSLTLLASMGEFVREAANGITASQAEYWADRLELLTKECESC